ncbi:hypothetical protein GCM10010178_88490 [Lentzea flava]|uniref:Uncharacterized protein n=1 Tax=Lentzea flava TaxID=103732 RepID=A0ABQ2VFM1_9PSEU|nr:hypothetical protein GCM10010178_88490 [Lentzea flava]
MLATPLPTRFLGMFTAMTPWAALSRVVKQTGAGQVLADKNDGPPGLPRCGLRHAARGLCLPATGMNVRSDLAQVELDKTTRM